MVRQAILALLAAASAAFAAAGPGRAVQPHPPRPDDTRLETQERAEIALQRFARCVVGNDLALVAAIVDPPLRADESFRLPLLRQADRLMGMCLAARGGASLGARWQTMLGAFAAELYVHRFRHLPVLGQVEVPAAADGDPLGIRATRVFALCLIARDAAAVDTLVRSNTGSDRERAALAGLAPLLDGCQEAGHPVALDRLTIRVYLSDLLYRRALAGRRAGAAH